MKLFVERVVSYGITLTRTSNCWNDFEEMRGEVIELRESAWRPSSISSTPSRRATPTTTTRENARSGRDPSLSNLLQRRRRFADAGAGANADPGDHAKRRRRSGRIPCPLQQRPGAALLSRSGQASASLPCTRRFRRSPTARRNRRSSTWRKICALWATRRWSTRKREAGGRTFHRSRRNGTAWRSANRSPTTSRSICTKCRAA